MDNEFDYSAHEAQKITDIDIKKEVKTSFIEYAMSVIIGRALPDVRDGMKPVHRRILYSMFENRMFYNEPYRKSAFTVGYVLGHYHPHGDAAVYDAMVRLAQSFSLRYPLVDGQGNFGNIDGDGAAAYRYTEARMSKIANLMLQDIDKDVIDWMPNFDNKLMEPVVLPSRFPNLLVNGSIGIAVGMATNIPPHNMGEVVDAVNYLIDHPDCEVTDLMQFIKAPDFPTAGIIHGLGGVYEAYATGHGRIKVRAKAHFEEGKTKTAIIVTELPYQVNRALLLENIATLVKNKRIEGITAIRNESNLKKGMRIVIELKRDANPQVVLNQLYRNTQMEDTFAVNMLALVNGEPKTLTLKQMLVYYLRHQEDIITRRTRFELDKAEKEAHIFEGYKIAIANLDEVIAIIRASANIPESKENLMARFGFSEPQAQAIVDMTLGRLSGMERQKIEERLEYLYKHIEELKGILADESKITDIIRNDLNEIKEKYGDPRRTAIEVVENEILDEDLIDREDCVITVTNAGYIKRLSADTYSAQNRGGKGITGMETKEEDFVKDVFVVHSHDYLLLFSNLGKMYIKKCYEIPEAGRTSKGTNLVNVLSLSEGETITAGVSVTEFTEDYYLTMITRMGIAKRVNLMDYRTRRTNGLYAITLDEGDALLYVMKTTGSEQIIAATHQGKSIRFDENDIRCMGRHARGVRAIKLADDDYVVGAAVIPEVHSADGPHIITVTENGYGKKTDIDEFTLQNRSGSGIICHKLSEKTGLLAGIDIVNPTDDIMLITDSGMIIRTRSSDINVIGRNTGGVIVMRLKEGDRLMSFAKIKQSTEDTAENENNENTENTPETDISDAIDEGKDNTVEE